jgi:hypothetical protein
MAVQSHILVPGGSPAVTATLGANASSAEIVLGKNCIFLVVCVAACQIKFGNTGMSAADATSQSIPSNYPMTFDTGDQFTSIRIFSTPGSLYSVLKLAKS